MILVTGGTGYIGSHTCVELLEKSYEIVIVDNLSNSTIDVIDGIEAITGKKPSFEKMDLTDSVLCRELFEKYPQIDSAIHFAAHKAVGESVLEPLKYYRNNLVSLLNVLEIGYEYQLKNIVFSSSCTVYGQPDELPVLETSPIKKADSPYGNTKQISEEFIQDFIASGKDFRAVALRYFNPIGAHESAEIGELPLGVPNNLVPYITQTAAGIRKQLSVFGNDYNTPDGTAIRDYIHVSDLAKAHIAALEYMNRRMTDKYDSFNIGTGSGNTVLEVIREFERVTGEKIDYRFAPRRSGDIEKVWADASKAFKILHWKTEKSLGDALLSAWIREKKYRGLK